MSIRIDISPDADGNGPRNVWLALWRGWRSRCPACGRGSIYGKFLKVVDACPVCGTELHHHRADDAPPYFTMLIVGHVVVGGALVLERLMALSLALELAIWITVALGLSLWLLPRVKGALIGLQWALRMHGFGTGPDPAEPMPVPSAAGADGERPR